jgi:hypothetical protein
MTPLITSLVPVRGAEYDHAKPETRAPWLAQRQGGITATEIRDWGQGSKKREIINFKVTGDWADLTGVQAVDHGVRREVVIAQWMQGKFGIEPSNALYAHPENPRHLATPDGVTLDPFSRELVVNSVGAAVAEIKTSAHDLTPGKMDGSRWLIEIDRDSYFLKSNYYTQIQWQMYVMNATVTLFIYERHNGEIDSETGTYTPIGAPEWCWIPRDDALIDVLVNKVAPAALAEIDAARTALKPDGLPPVSDFPSEDAVLVAEVLRGRTAESTAKTSRERAWKALNEKYVGPDKPDCTHDLGFATFTVSTSTPAATTRKEKVTDWDAVFAGLTDAQRKKVQALIEKHTTEQNIVTEGVPKQALTITQKKGQEVP